MPLLSSRGSEATRDLAVGFVLPEEQDFPSGDAARSGFAVRKDTTGAGSLGHEPGLGMTN